jgi:hypothetical protein
MTRKLKFEGVFSVGQRIRGYDYDPKEIEGNEVFAEGLIIAIENMPFRAYRILCTLCTGYGREGKEICIPMERATAEFDGRIVLARHH